MPINKAHFDSGADSTELDVLSGVLKFLEGNRTKAFTLREVAHGTRVITRVGFTRALSGDTVKMATLSAALDHGVSQGMLLKKTIDGENYYAIKAK